MGVGGAAEHPPFSGRADLEGLVVEDEYRANGIGEMLLDAAQAWASRRGCTALRLLSNVTRERAHRFYRRLGYEVHKDRTRSPKISMIGLAYCDKAGRIFFDERREPLADGGIVRAVHRDELIPAPAGTVPDGAAGTQTAAARRASRRAGMRWLLCCPQDTHGCCCRHTHAPAMLLRFRYSDIRSRAWWMTSSTSPRCAPMRAKIGSRDISAKGELEAILDRRIESDRSNRVLAQVALCSREYGCFTAQNVFLERGEAALPVSPKCNARCVGCISEQEPDAGLPSPQTAHLV